MGPTRDDKQLPPVHYYDMGPVLPRLLHRIALRTAHALRLWWWRGTRRTVRGCNVIAVSATGQVLLVRHSYHARDCWMLPGGGLASTEEPIVAAARELAEETGCTLHDARHLGTITLDRSGWTNLIELVGGETGDTPHADGREIEEASFFDPLDLPENTSGSVRAIIARWHRDQNGNSA